MIVDANSVQPIYLSLDLTWSIVSFALCMSCGFDASVEELRKLQEEVCAAANFICLHSCLCLHFIQVIWTKKDQAAKLDEKDAAIEKLKESVALEHAQVEERDASLLKAEARLLELGEGSQQLHQSQVLACWNAPVCTSCKHVDGR